MVMNAMVFYNLIHYFNRNVLNPNQPQQQLKTLRAEHFILPAQLGNSGGDWVLRLGVRSQKFRGKICHVLERIMRIPHRLNCNAVGAATS